VLGIALDGLGLGEHGEIWGGEFLLADYRGFRRLATFMPVAMPGGDQAAREPWRNLYAQLVATLGRDAFIGELGQLDLRHRLEAKPLALVDAMLRARLQAPLASSCGRLFDAFAAAIGVAFERQAYEGQAGALLESLATAAPANDGSYPFTIAARADGLPQLEMRALWRAVLADLVARTPVPVMAARFHRGLASALCAMTTRLVRLERFDTVALSGGCFQNRVLFEHTARELTSAGFSVLTHEQVPPNDGGLALGQAAIAAATLLARCGV
jgi:hydrogenase maturation protein HypF